ncbi:hypothetical protein LX32DRAFT_698612 [Colletotrichum zoysiae]|uniref:Uncharacterized protein n=1 Tax=Colletotrichum zoysiae TaxID=1216348 RepID=A0AAD9H637_9PEZI|nr:hypothetical protein LX32DRAFT_698612 [Colletotrichum zoysiae]
MGHGEELLAEVHAHAVEYLATKDARHMAAAQSIVENALKTDVTPWVKSVHPQMLLKKKTMTVPQGNSAVEELFTLYPQLNREEMRSLTGEVVSKVSIIIFL